MAATKPIRVRVLILSINFLTICFFGLSKYTKANGYFENFLMSQKIITSTITTITIPTQTPALKIAPMAWQLSNDRMRTNRSGSKFNFVLYMRFRFDFCFLILNCFQHSILVFFYLPCFDFCLSSSSSSSISFSCSSIECIRFSFSFFDRPERCS